MQFADKVTIITGAGSGIGRELARNLLRQGARVVLVGRRLEKLEESIQGTHNAHLATPISADLSKLKEIRRVVSTTMAKHGRIDVLVNNAGIVYAGAIDKVTAAEVDYLMRVNVTSPIWLTQEVIPHLKARPEAMIVNVCSIAGLVPIPCQSNYCASKFALSGFSQALRREFMTGSIRVVTVYPGRVDSELQSDSVRRKAVELGLPMADSMKADAAADVIAEGMRDEAKMVYVANTRERALARMNHVLPALVDRALKRMRPQIEGVLETMTEWTRSRTAVTEPE